MLKSFFILCSGSDSDILKSCSNGEQNKYAGIGATVFFTAVMAGIAASYALYTVFDSVYMAIGFGLIWGLLIFNLDRFIVSTIKKRDRFLDECIQALPRIVLAIIIAIVISKPLELKIFEKEINHILLEQKNELTLANKEQIAQQFNPKISDLNNEIASLELQIIEKENNVNNLYDTYISEAEGTAGTKLLGKGPVYKEKRDKHDASLAELQSLKQTNADKITALEKETAALDLEYADQVTDTQPIINGFDGLMARDTGLDNLPWLPSYFLFLLVLGIETSPIIARLLSPKGAYDYKMEDDERAVRSWVSQKVTQREKVLETDTILNNRIYGEIAEEE